MLFENEVYSVWSLVLTWHNIYCSTVLVSYNTDLLEDQCWCQVQQKQIFIIWQQSCLVCAVYVDVCLSPAPISKGLWGMGLWGGVGVGVMPSMFAFCICIYFVVFMFLAYFQSVHSSYRKQCAVFVWTPVHILCDRQWFEKSLFHLAPFIT